MVTRRLQAERRTGSVRRPKTGVPPTVLSNQPIGRGIRSLSGFVTALFVLMSTNERCKVKVK